MVRGWTEPVKGGKTEKIDIGRPARVPNCHSTLTRVAERRLTYTSNLEGEVHAGSDHPGQGGGAACFISLPGVIAGVNAGDGNWEDSRR
jgi:hypothetical protein